MSYIPTEWQTGDIITAAKLNNIENGIVNNEEAIDDAELKVLEYDIEGELVANPYSTNTFSSVKINVTGGSGDSYFDVTDISRCVLKLNFSNNKTVFAFYCGDVDFIAYGAINSGIIGVDSRSVAYDNNIYIVRASGVYANETYSLTSVKNIFPIQPRTETDGCILGYMSGVFSPLIGYYDFVINSCRLDVAQDFSSATVTMDDPKFISQPQKVISCRLNAGVYVNDTLLGNAVLNMAEIGAGMYSGIMYEPTSGAFLLLVVLYGGEQVGWLASIKVLS